MSYSPWGHEESDTTEQLTLTYYDPAIPLLDMYTACVCVLSLVLLFMTLWTVAYQDPLSLGLSRQEYWRPSSRESSRPRGGTLVSDVSCVGS